MTNKDTADIFAAAIAIFCLTVALIIFGIYIVLPCAIIYLIYKSITHKPAPEPPTTEQLYQQAQLTYFPNEYQFIDSFGDKLFNPLDQLPAEHILYKILSTARDLYRAENLTSTPLLIPREGTLEEARYRDQLTINPLPIINQIQDTLVTSMNIYIKSLPQSAFTEGEPKYTIPLKDTLSNLPQLVEELTFPFFYRPVQDIGLFKGLRTRLIENGDRVNEKKPTPPEEYKGDDVVKAYLGGTPLEQLFSAKIPIVIPEEAYFQGQWIVGPPGTMKTQFIQTQICDLLPKVMEGKASIIVMDSQEQLINNIQCLDQFTGAGKLVVIDANDIEFPVALNIFDLGVGEDISPVEKERTLNAALELTMFLLDSLLGSDLTGKQAVVFRFIMQAIFAIPNATIYTLEDLLSKGGSTKYKQYLDTLDGAANRFFANEFDTPDFVKTKKEIIQRLYGILGIKQWERMFNNPHSKFDLFSEMNAGKVILINSAYSLLQPKGCEAFGRFFLCLIAMASHRRATMKGENIPVHIFIDEIENYLGTTTADSNFTGILEQCRKQKVAMTVAHQYLSQLGQRTIDTLQGVTIKCASALTDRDAHTMARGMRTKPDFLEQQPRGSFAMYVRNTTPTAISIKVPFGVMEALPRMSQAEQEHIRDLMRERYSTHHAPTEAEASHAQGKTTAEADPPIITPETPPIYNDPTKKAPEW